LEAVYFGQFFEKIQKKSKLLFYFFYDTSYACIHFDKNVSDYIFGHFFSKTHLVALAALRPSLKYR
jgi:hypothetical protein